MTKIGQVVVGVDGSESSREAIEFAAESARLRGATLRVVHAFIWPLMRVPVGPLPDGPPEGGLRNDAERIVAEAVEQAVRAEPGIRASGEVVTGAPAAVLIQESRRADAVVVGNRGLGGFTGLLIGSVGVSVAAHAGCPVTVVRPREGEGPSTGRVVVGVDGSSSSEYALATAFEEASLRSTGLTVIHGWTAPASLGDGQVPLAYDPDTVASNETHLLNDLLADWQRRYPGLDVRPQVLYAKPNKLLVQESQGAALLVVGSRGRGGFRGLLLGSVSQAALHHAHCPVVVARGRHEQLAGSD